MDGRLWSEEILSADRDRGRQGPATSPRSCRRKPAERAEKQRRSSADERKDEQRSRGRRSLDIARDEVLPFGPDKRDGYDFTVEGTAELDGAPVIVLRSRSRVRSDEKFEGLYFVDPGDLRRPPGRADPRQEARPPQAHGDGDRLRWSSRRATMVMTKAVMRIHVGLIVKNIRIEAVESYSDHVVR